jgi:geranylgeranyl pyrophosphate synthase
MPPSSSVGTMKLNTATFFDLVRPQLDEVEERMRVSPGEHHPNMIAAIEHLLSSGGKRIRPTLTILTGGLLGVDREQTITLAAAIEMLHTATLVHDDLIDQSLLRRGIPTLNAQWSPGATVLTGDYIFARAAHLAADIGEKSLMRIFARTLMTIVNGEISQLFNKHSIGNRQDYFDQIYAKTASLFEAATEGIAILSGEGDTIVTSMKTFGYNVGMAFQIVDDVLDFTSDQQQVGKPVANDLKQGLLTLPTLHYLESHSDQVSLREAFLNGDMDDATLENLIESIRASDAIDKALKLAGDFISRGEMELKAMPAKRERDALYELGRYIINRAE